MKYTNLPAKWCIEINKENISFLNNFLKEYSKEYKGYYDAWECKVNYYFHYPQVGSAHSYDRPKRNHKKIFLKDFTSILDNYEIY